VGRDLVVAGASVNISGAVLRNAVIGGRDVTVGGAIRGDALIRAHRVVLLPTTRIGGTLRYAADQPIEVRSGAQIAGGTTQVPVGTPPRQALRAPLSPRFRLWRAVADAIALLVIGLVVFAVAPGAALPVVREVRERFGRSLLIGFILFVTVPVAAVLLVCTVFGIPLSVVGMLLYAATLYPALIFVAAWLGSSVLQRLRRGATHASMYGSVALGAVVLAVLFAVPWAGWLLRLFAMLAGFGALWTSLWRTITARPSSEARAAV
jgi:hypothetical protein